MNNNQDMNNFSLNSIENAGENRHEDIYVEIDNSFEVLLNAHNSSPEAHGNLLGTLLEKTDALTGAVSELEENMVLSTNIPTKLSQFENDINLVSEETLIQALEKRQIVNLTTLEGKLSKSEETLQNAIDTNNNTLTTKIINLENNLASAANPAAICSYAVPGAKSISLALPSDQQTITMPADGLLWINMRCLTSNAGSVILWRESSGSGPTLRTTGTNTHVATEILVAKGENVTVWLSGAVAEEFKFIYLKGNTPTETEEG